MVLPNGECIRSTHTGELRIANLPIENRTVHLFQDNELPHYPLLSIGQLCQSGHVYVTFNSNGVYVRETKTNKLILQGQHDKQTGLYVIDLAIKQHEEVPPGFTKLDTELITQYGLATIRHETNAQLTDFYSATLGSPVTSTFLTAVQKSFVEFPNLTAAILRRNRPDSIATAKGHLHRIRQGLRPTAPHLIETETDIFPTSPLRLSRRTPPTQLASVYVRIHSPTMENYADLAGRFPHVALNGVQYMLVMYAEDSNYIHIELMTSRRAKTLVAAYQRAIDFFAKRGLKPQFLRFDNESSTALESFASHQTDISIQFVAPGNHRANRAERAIQTWKEHFISTLCTTDPNFPMIAWHKLIPQAELTLNLLRGSRANPAISAWAHVNGPFIFNETPIAPAGMKILAFDGPDDRESWAPHGEEGFYVGPAFHHYRCYEVFIPKTKRSRITDTLSWHPPNFVLPGASPIDALTAAVTDLQTAINGLRRTPATCATLRQPLACVDSSLSTALQSLREIFHPAQHSDPPAPVSTTTHLEAQRVIPLPCRPDVGDSLPDSTSRPPQRVADHSSDQPTPTPLVDHPHSPGAPVIRPAPNPLPRRGTRLRRPKALAAITQCATHIPYRNAIRHTMYTLEDMIALGHHVPTAYLQPDTSLAPDTSQYALSAVDMDDLGRPLTFNRAKRGPEADQWIQGLCTEIDRLHATGTMSFDRPSSKPADRKASYMNPQVKKKPPQPNGYVEYRVRCTYGGNISDYTGPKSADVAHMTTVKLHLNSVVSTNSRWMTLDIKDYYLGTPMARTEYMMVPLTDLPDATITKYDLHAKAECGKVLAVVHKGIYGLPQAGRLAQDRLVAHLRAHGYVPAPNTPALFRHETRNISFVLVVDDFGVKYTSQEDADHLIATLTELYTIKVDWTGHRFVGFNIAYDKPNRKITLSMPQYIPNALKRFGIPSRGVNSPGPYTPFAKTTGPQLIPLADESPPLSPERANRVQQIVGVLSYYANAVDATLVTRTNKVSSMQASPTVAVEEAAERLLQYVHQWPAAELVYYASDMRLIVHSDGSYLSESDARSRVGGVSYCGNTDDDTLINGPIKCISRILDCVVASAAETEYGSLFYNAREAAEQRNTLTDMGHPQETTLIVCDNSCAVGVANSTTRQRRSKAWDMRFHWIRDRVRQDQFDVVWRKGQVNLADYFTKDHPTKHFMAMRPFFVQTPARGLTDTARSRRIQNRVARQGARPPNGGHRRLTTADLPSPKAPRVTQSPRPTLS